MSFMGVVRFNALTNENSFTLHGTPNHIPPYFTVYLTLGVDISPRLAVLLRTYSKPLFILYGMDVALIPSCCFLLFGGKIRSCKLQYSKTEEKEEEQKGKKIPRKKEEGKEKVEKE